MKLTPANARDAKPGTTLRDHEVTGLQLRCGAERKSWQLYYTTRERIERRPTIGHFPEMSLSRARDVARTLKDHIAMGEDPSGNWQARKEAPSVSDLTDSYLEKWVAKKNGRAWAEACDRYARMIRLGLGRIKVADVRREHVDDFLADVLARKYARVQPRKDGTPRKDAGKKTSPVAMNRCRSVLSKMFYHAEELGWVVYDFRRDAKTQHANPARYTERSVERKRKVVATPQILPRLATALRAIENEHPADTAKGIQARRRVACIWTIFLTGARVSEILHATGLEMQTGGIVKTEHKTTRYIGDKTVHVPRVARHLLELLPVCKSGRLFGVIRLRWVWSRVRKKADCPDLQLRDARRTFASYARSIGVTTDMLADLFGHTDIATTHENYTFALADAKQEAVERTAARIMSAAGGVQRPNQRLFRRRRFTWPGRKGKH